MLDNAMRLGPGRRLHNLKLTSQRMKVLQGQVGTGALTILWFLTNFSFLNYWMDEACEQRAAFCFLVSGWMCCVFLGGVVLHTLNGTLQTGAKYNPTRPA